LNKAFAIKYNDKLEKYQIITVDADTVSEGTIIFETREDANGGYIMRFLQAGVSERDKYFEKPSLAYQD